MQVSKKSSIEIYVKEVKRMKYFLITIGIIAFIGFMLFTWIAGSYNNLVTLRNEGQTQQAQIETQLQRRFDLVPNLVATVKGGMAQERAVFKAIADARTKYAGAKSGTPDKLEAGSEYQSAIARLLVVMENYPQLRSLDTVQDLMVQLEGSENRISVARQRYNEAVRDYNRVRQTFPTNILAGMFNFEVLPLFQSVEGAEKAPKVNFAQ